jgi:cell division septation protein DedD
MLAGGLATVALLIASGVLPQAFLAAQTREGWASTSAGSIPLIKAEPGPIKTKPADPGGLKIPHRDKDIYKNFEDDRRAAAAGKMPAGRKNTAPSSSANKDGRKLAENIGPYRVQLGSYAKGEIAQRQWKSLRARHADLVEGLQMFVERVEIPQKGTLFRLQAGPLKSPEDAQKLCAALARRKVACFPVKG